MNSPKMFKGVNCRDSVSLDPIAYSDIIFTKINENVAQIVN